MNTIKSFGALGTARFFLDIILSFSTKLPDLEDI